MDKVSVIIPLYNTEEYVSEAVNSILNQTYSNFELLIINDGSTDLSYDLVKKFRDEDNRVKIISRSNNIGTALTINEGIELATGKYVALMDSDDVALNTRLEKQVKYLEVHKDVVLCGTNMSIFGEYEKTQMVENYMEEVNTLFDSTNCLEIFMKYCAMGHPTVMGYADVFKEIKYDGRYESTEDYAMWLRVLAAGYKIGKVNEELIRFRKRDNSKSAVLQKHNLIAKSNVTLKLNILPKITEKKIKKYLLWGAGNGGKLCKEIIDNLLPQAELVSYIDNYKEGQDIKKVEAIPSIEHDYIFIASTPARKEAMEVMGKLGKHYIDDYLILV